MVAVAVIGFFAQELASGAKTRISKVAYGPVWDYVDAYFPEKVNEFERNIAQSLQDLNRKVDALLMENALKNIQDVQVSLIKNSRFLRRELLPFLAVEATQKKHRDYEIKKYLKSINVLRMELGVGMELGGTLLQQRLSTCDYPARVLYNCLLEMAALELVYLSWEYFLNQSLRSPSAATLCMIQQQYTQAKNVTSELIRALCEQLCRARLQKCEFTSMIKGAILEPNKNVERSAIWSMICEFKDTFSSEYENDPFGGRLIHEHHKFEVSMVSTNHDFSSELAKLRNLGRMHREHLYALEDLNDLYIREPANQLLDEIERLPYFLSESHPELEISEGRLPPGWNKDPQLLHQELPGAWAKHPSLRDILLAKQDRKPGCIGRRLLKNQRLTVGEYLESPNKNYRLLMNTNERFELICTINNQRLWERDTLSDIYKITANNSDQPATEQGESQVKALEAQECHSLLLKDTGDLVMYNESGSGRWKTYTFKINRQRANMLQHLVLLQQSEQTLGPNGCLHSANGKYKLILGEDGNLLLFIAKNRATVWETGTSGSGATELRMQSDGNLVLYKKDRSAPVWATGTSERDRIGCRAVLEDWGELVLYNPRHEILWSSLDHSVSAHRRRQESK